MHPDFLDENKSFLSLHLLDRSGASGAGLQGAGGEKHVPAGSSHQQRPERLAGAHAGQNLAAPLCAAAALRGPQHPAPAAPPGHPVQGLCPHGEGGDQQREYQDGLIEELQGISPGHWEYQQQQLVGIIISGQAHGMFKEFE